MQIIIKPVKAIIALLIVTFLVSTFPACFGQTRPGTKNIILVHGAFVDGSGWQPVYQILTKKGYRVTIVQQPLTSFQADLAAATMAKSIPQHINHYKKALMD